MRRGLSRSSSQVAEQRWEETNVHGVGHFVTLTDGTTGGSWISVTFSRLPARPLSLALRIFYCTFEPKGDRPN